VIERDEISVVLPVKGECPWLEEALISLANQTLLPLIVHLIDDGVSDPQKIDVIGTKILGKLYKRTPNVGKGISDALNTGIQLCQTRWVARMDGDDIARPQRFEDQLTYLNTNKHLLGCGGQVRIISKLGHSMGISDYPCTQDLIASQSLKKTCFAHPCLMIQRNALLETPYRNAMDGAEDVDLVLRLLERGEIGNSSKIILDYRIGEHQQNYSQRARQTALQELAFRLAYLRRSGQSDPLNSSPGLAEQFVAWRFSQKGYSDARLIMTAMRYLLEFARIGDWIVVRKMLVDVLKSRVWHPSVIKWIICVTNIGNGGLALQVTGQPDLVELENLNFEE